MSIAFKDVNYIYSPDMPYAFKALSDINFELPEKKIIGVIGHTGSGKSTLIQHLNALLLPSSGEVIVDEFTVKSEKNKNLKQLRKKVGLVFQFSEYQLFEETILKDVAFGPKNFGASVSEAEASAKEALKLVGIDKSYYERSPLDLSGGQKRRVAIAGILAMKPDIIVLDEPTAGLDPHGAREMIRLFQKLNQENGTSIIIVCHDNEIVYRYCDYALVMNKGELVYQGSSKELFENESNREKFNLLAPNVIEFQKQLKENGFNLKENYEDMESLVKAVAKELK